MEQPEQEKRHLKGFKAVSLLTLLSRITGLGRDALMASLFGTGGILDAFTIAFRIPNLFRRLFGEGAMTAAFLPEFVRTDEQQGRHAAAVLFSGVAWRLFKILLTCTVLVEIAIAVTYFSLSLSDRSTLLCELSMIMMPYMLLICMAGLYAAALHGVQHFVFPALAPIALNLIWLTGGLFAALRLATGPNEVRLIAAFIVAGGILQLGMMVYKAATFGIRQTMPPAQATEQTSTVFRAMAPVLLGLSVTQINVLIDSLLAYGLSSGNLAGIDSVQRFRLPEGTAGALYLGQRLFSFPMGVFAVALGTVLFPRFAKHAQNEDRVELNRDIIHGLQLVLVVGVPASAGLWFMASPITDLLFRYGQFGAAAAEMTSSMIAAFGTGVWIFSGLLIVNRVFYAANDQMTPMRQGLICVGLNLLFDVLLLPVLGGQALPAASVLATLFQLGLALEVLRKRNLLIGREAFVPLLWRVGLCTVVMSCCGVGLLHVTSTWDGAMNSFGGRVVQVLVPIGGAIAIYIAGLFALGLSPVQLLREAKSFGPALDD